MKTYEFTGSAKIRGKDFDVTIKTSIEPSNCLYLCIDNHPDLSKTTIFIKPFIPKMLDIYGKNIDEGFKYKFSGNNVGHLSYGAGNADGVWDSWTINSILMEFSYYQDRVHLIFSGNTERGDSTWKGTVHEETKGKLEPFDFDINFFIPIDEFSAYLEQEPQKIDQEKAQKRLIDHIKNSAPSYHQ
jgi:hypothetical protein